jgi:hypothetical protein
LKDVFLRTIAETQAAQFGKALMFQQHHDVRTTYSIPIHAKSGTEVTGLWFWLRVSGRFGAPTIGYRRTQSTGGTTTALPPACQAGNFFVHAGRAQSGRHL